MFTMYFPTQNALNIYLSHYYHDLNHHHEKLKKYTFKKHIYHINKELRVCQECKTERKSNIF